jgi:hypothetical protein
VGELATDLATVSRNNDESRARRTGRGFQRANSDEKRLILALDEQFAGQLDAACLQRVGVHPRRKIGGIQLVALIASSQLAEVHCAYRAAEHIGYGQHDGQ